MRSFNVFLALLVSLLIGVAVLEAGLRVIGFGPPHNLNRFDAVTGWSKTPDAVQTKRTPEFDITLETNAFGLRDDPMSARDKAPGTNRVVALGDSFTLGYTVERDNLFVDILERWWRAEERRTDVINGGTEGWSTDQEVAWFLAEGHLYQPDLVLVFAYENDLYWSSETQYPPRLDKPRFGSDGQLEQRELEDHAGNSWVDDWALTRLLLSPKPDRERFWFTPEGGTKPILKEWGAVLVDRPAFMLDAEARTAGALKALKRRCDEIGARAVVVPIPSHSFVDEEYRSEKMGKRLGLPPQAWSPEVPVDTFLRLASEVGLDGIDLRGPLSAAAEQGKPLYFDVDWHFNPHGNAVFASALKAEIDRRGYFPAGFAPTQVVATLPEAPSKAKGGAPFAVKLFVGLWAALSALYILTYRDEPVWQPPLKVAGLLTSVFIVFFGARFLIALVPPQYAPVAFVGLIGSVLIFVAYKLGHRVGTIFELMRSFTMRGHWYLMPLIVVLLTVGSLLVVAASSPLIAPFIYTLF